MKPRGDPGVVGMISIDEGFVDRAAPNAEAGKNGRGLVLKNKLTRLHVSEDETILFGECQGSGKDPYRCSCDFLYPDKVTHRCSCPSRQFPCKHCLGLMYAYVQGKAFSKAPIPEDLQAKREKVQARAEKQKEEVKTEKPRQVNKTALARKIQAQLDGIEVLRRLTTDLLRLGIGNMNARMAREMEDQAKQLGNAYLPGAQAAIHTYTKLFAGQDGKFAETPRVQQEQVFTEALDQLSRLHALVKQGRTYLEGRLEDPDLKPEVESDIAAWLGHSWHLKELKEAGLVENDVELVQLAFNSHDDRARQEFVDLGIWMTLGNGRIRLTQSFRPHKAAKFIKSDDSFFQVAQVQELCVYPGDVNPRIRWEAMQPRPLVAADLEKVRGFGQGDFGALVKEVKKHLKGPLADRRPVYALNYRVLGRIGETLVVQDAGGERLVLTDHSLPEEPSTCHLLSFFPAEYLENNTLIARFSPDLDRGTLQVKPLSLVTRQQVIRLTF